MAIRDGGGSMMGHRLPPAARRRPREFDYKNKRTYRFVREEGYDYFEQAVQEFIENNPDYEIVESPFKMPSNDLFIATFKLKDKKEVKNKTTVKD